MNCVSTLVLLLSLYQPFLAMSQVCGGITYSACMSCTSSTNGCTSNEKTVIKNMTLPYYINAFSSLGLTPPTSWLFPSTRRRGLGGNAIDVIDNQHETNRELISATCRDYCKISTYYCYYYGCNTGGRRSLAVSGEEENQSRRQVIEVNTKSLAELEQEGVGAVAAQDSTHRDLQLSCDNVQYYLSNALINASYVGYSDAYKSKFLSSTCKSTIWQISCNMDIILTLPDNGCCSQDFKTCINWCGLTNVTCGSCNKADSFIYLPNGAITGSCLPRWTGGCSSSSPCCNGLRCQKVNAYYSQCMAPTDK